MKLHEIADLGDKVQLQEWMDSLNEGESPDLNAGDEENGYSALHFAAARGHSECVQLLLAKGANVNHASNTSKTTPLHEAARSGSVETVKALVEGGGDVNAVDAQGWSVLHYAAGIEEEEPAKDIVSLLLSKGGAKEVTSGEGVTPLHVAASRGSQGALQELIRQGVPLQGAQGSSQGPPLNLLRVSAVEVPLEKDFKREVGEDLSQMVGNSLFSDVKLVTADETFAGHGIVLTSRSSHFRHLLSSSTELTFSDISGSHFRTVLEFLYSGNSPQLETPPSPSFPLQMWEIAKRFEMQNLQALISSTITAQSALIEKDVEALRKCMGIVKSGEEGPMGTFCASLLLRSISTLLEGNLLTELSPEEWAAAISRVTLEDTRSLTPTSPIPTVPTPPQTGDSRPLVGKNLRIAKGIIKGVIKEPNAHWFSTPVNPTLLGLPDYFDIIKHPMDLGTISKKLEKNAYATLGELRADVQLVFANCRLYNTPTNEIAKMGDVIEQHFEAKVASAAWEDVPAKGKGINSPSMGKVEGKKRKAEGVLKGDTPLKKSKDAPMTFEEKKRLGQAMNSLDSDQLIKAIDILKECPKIQEKQTAGDEDSDTIDIDMNEVDDHTLRRLEQFIEQCGVQMKQES